MTSERAEHNGVLEDLCDHAAQLISAADARLLKLSIRTGDTAVELEWSPAATAAASTAPTAAPPGVLAVPAEPVPAEAVQAQPVQAQPVPAEAVQAAATELESLHHLRAEMVGTFYSAPEPGADPFVCVGDEVQAGQQVAILEVMKLMTPVEADRPGRVVDVLVSDGTPVEYGTALIALDTTPQACRNTG
ncbi:acetyl-CoA carboxylase biotin carboxyl carrier protein [Actinomadura rudentiformis]|uniref:Biotin carboxyl carrier protein of acetyl-CoA carboxylase n=1 Tax=Actinomadura rudentiformis TaxID=359158 RepID=A0A6H9YJP5_9ACTN|nr:biotin/lipoyl-containing protein [Actinomadura rudentiformis]KAB2344497.1 acetyl-CoA carboxylase, biotin carboxyl carrier protein [Actinomadura rudentiformis]